MGNCYNFLQSAKMNIYFAAYLDVGNDWKNMVNEFLYVRIYYIRCGSAKLTLLDGTIDLEEGYLYFIPAFSILHGSCENHLGHYFIHIIPDLLTEHFFKAFPITQKCKMDTPIADYLFRTVISNYQEHSIASEIATDSALKLLLSNFFVGLDAKTSRNNITRFTKIFEYIDQHINEKIYIKDLSSLIFMDETYFSNLFKKTFGISLQKYILNKKTDRAKSLLATDITISEIANSLNFFDAAAFTKFFKKQTNITPTEFRQKLLQKQLL